MGSAAGSGLPAELLQGRLLAAGVQFVLAAALWVIWLGWIVHIWSIIDAARFQPVLSNEQ